MYKSRAVCVSLLYYFSAFYRTTLAISLVSVIPILLLDIYDLTHSNKLRCSTSHTNRPPGAGFLLPGQRSFPLAAAAPHDPGV